MIHDGIKDLFASERGVFCILLLVAATVLAVFGTVTSQQWLDFAKWLATVLVASKTVTGAVEMMKPAQQQPASSPAPTPTKE